jgi:hypothetical protein
VTADERAAALGLLGAEQDLEKAAAAAAERADATSELVRGGFLYNGAVRAA